MAHPGIFLWGVSLWQTCGINEVTRYLAWHICQGARMENLMEGGCITPEHSPKFTPICIFWACPCDLKPTWTCSLLLLLKLLKTRRSRKSCIRGVLCTWLPPFYETLMETLALDHQCWSIQFVVQQGPFIYILRFYFPWMSCFHFCNSLVRNEN